MEDFDIYALGLTSASVCASRSLSPGEIVMRMNALEPTGITSPWELATDESFRDGTPNPGPCKQDPGRVHYLLHC